MKCCCPSTVNISILALQQKYLYRQSQYSNTWDSKCLALIAQVAQLQHLAWIQRLGVWVPLRSRYFLYLKLRHFHKNIRSWVEKAYCCPGTVNISNVSFTTKHIHTHTRVRTYACTYTICYQYSPPPSSSSQGSVFVAASFMLLLSSPSAMTIDSRFSG